MDIEEMYQEVILEHYKRPKNHGNVENPDIDIDGYNPLCGDEIKITAVIENGNIKKIGFTGSGCAISQASASMMTNKMKGKSFQEFKDYFEEFSGMLKGNGKKLDTKKFGNLLALEGVASFPARVKCAMLSWQALKEGVDKIADNNE